MACTLGINSAYHEPAAALVVDGELVAMAEEERFNRVKHGKRSRVDNPDELPLAAAEFCLRQGGRSWADVDAIGYSLDPARRLEANRGRNRVSADGWGTEEGERTFHDANLRARDALRERAPGAAFSFLPHHLCHAASAYLVSPFDEAAILVADGIGELDSTWLGVGSGGAMTALETVPFPSSIGFVWEVMSELLGFDAYNGPGKLMGYGSVTDPRGELSGRDHLSALREIFGPVEGGTFFVDNDAFRFATGDYTGLEARFGARRLSPVDRYEEASIAAALQTVTDDVMVHLARRLYERINAGRASPITDLCMAGGVALNCVSNHAIATRTPFRRIWVQPAANDAGTALGAAALLHAARSRTERPRMAHAYLGPGFSDEACRDALQARGLGSRRLDDAPAEVAARIERGEIVAWFQGRQEVGPRALGNRSIVADPSRFDTRGRINERVKRRESFRPFAPSVRPAAVERFFDAPPGLLATRFMLATLPLKERQFIQVIPAVVQENGSTGLATSRVQVVEDGDNPRYAALIDAFASRTGLPLVLNTSFNIQEPIVTTPQQAVATFLRSSMDALVLGPWLATRPEAGR